jgi:hypothetical protein
MPHIVFEGAIGTSTSAGTSANSDIYKAYPINVTSNVWFVDKTDSNNPCVIVQGLRDDASTTNGRVYFSFIPSATIWGSPMEGARVTDLKRAVEFSKIYLDLGASYIEQADHDGSADPARVYEYFSMILDPDLTGKWADPKYHLAHFHTSRGMGLANVLAALQAGMIRFESTLSGIGGQPANMIDGRLVSGTGKYYHKEHLLSGLVTTEDLVVVMESMGIDTGVDILKLLDIGRKFRDKYLYISPAQMNAIISAVSEFTGISNGRLVNLRESDKELGNFVEEAVKFLVKPGEEEPKRIRESLMQLFNSLSGYLRRGMWAVSRAETIVSDVPPSPFLKDLL